MKYECAINLKTLFQRLYKMKEHDWVDEIYAVTPSCLFSFIHLYDAVQSDTGQYYTVISM